MWGLLGWLPLPGYLIWRALCALIILPRMNRRYFGYLSSLHLRVSPVVTSTLQWLLFELAAQQFHLVNIIDANNEQALMTFFFAWSTTALVFCAPLINRGEFFLQPVYCNKKTYLPVAAAAYVFFMFLCEVGMFIIGYFLRAIYVLH